MSPNENERSMLIAESASAWRPRAPGGRLLEHPAWADLDPEARLAAFDEALVMRVFEAAADPDGYSTTVRAVARMISSS